MKKISIEIPATVKSLTYNPYGKEVYEKQVKNQVDFADMNEIIFPDQVEKVSSSFVQGFFADVIDTIGIDAISRHFTIVSPSEKLKACFREGLV